MQGVPGADNYYMRGDGDFFRFPNYSVSRSLVRTRTKKDARSSKFKMQPVGTSNLGRGVKQNLYNRYSNRSSQNEERSSDLLAAVGLTRGRALRQ